MKAKEKRISRGLKGFTRIKTTKPMMQLLRHEYFACIACAAN